MIITFSDCTVKGVSAIQEFAPIVFGMISERMRIARVIATGTIKEVITGFVSSQISAACWPTPIAPTVSGDRIESQDRGQRTVDVLFEGLEPFSCPGFLPVT